MQGIFAGRRPTKLPFWFLSLLLSLLFLSFVSGVLAWWGQNQNAKLDPLTDARGFPVKFWLMVHGWLNPLLCAAFGYLLAQHIRLGWRMRANVRTGLLMSTVFGGLILTGAALYYAGGEKSRTYIVLMHRILGLGIPLILGLHWWRASKWLKKVEISS